jgi:hypothetical protein
MTDNSDAFAQWPSQQDKSNYAHTPIINKVVITEKKTTKPSSDSSASAASGSGSMEKSLSALKTKARVVDRLPVPAPQQRSNTSNTSNMNSNKVPPRFPGGGRGDVREIEMMGCWDMGCWNAGMCQNVDFRLSNPMFSLLSALYSLLSTLSSPLSPLSSPLSSPQLKGKRHGNGGYGNGGYGNGVRGLTQDSISEMHDEDSIGCTIASAASTPERPEAEAEAYLPPSVPSNLIGCGVNELLLKANQLLLDVTGCIKPDTQYGNNKQYTHAQKTVPLELSRRVEGLLQQRDVPTTHYTGGHPDLGVGTPSTPGIGGPRFGQGQGQGQGQGVHEGGFQVDSDLAQIDWLLRGLPEAYESEPTYDDEAVEAILKEGGPPPTQLALPSVYAANQRTLNKLSEASILRIELKHLLVFSVRYGVRKNGTYILLHPPAGCKTPPNQPSSIMLPLQELDDLSLTLRKDTRDTVRNYFVGSADLSKGTEIDLNISDEIMRQWINLAPGGSLRVELYGQLAPRASKILGNMGTSGISGNVKVSQSEAVRLAYALVPLGGILGTSSLDAVLHCDLEVDQASHSSICSRMHNVNFGHR